MVANGDNPMVRSLAMPAAGSGSAGALWRGVPVSHRAGQSGQGGARRAARQTAALLVDGVGRLSPALRQAADQARK
jgi:hypothetical protein